MREKYKQIWDVIKNKLSIKFHSKPIYQQKYLKAKVSEFVGMIKTNLLGNEVPTKNMHYAWIACIAIDSVMRIDKKKLCASLFRECNYRLKKIQMSRFINTELRSDSHSEPDSEVESKSDAELMAKLKPDSDSV